MVTPRIGSLCSGYGGLEMGLMAVVGGSVAWHAEVDKHPAAVLDVRFPGVPNLGDITTTDWTQVEPVDWLTAGYPCQPFSHAGKRKGSADERHLWPFVAGAVGALRPRRVLLENVAGHVSLGLDAVLWDLAALGYDATWGVVRAADAGAPHRRERVFIVASDAQCERESGRRAPRDVGSAPTGGAGEGLQRQRDRDAADDRGAAAPDSNGGARTWHGIPERRDSRPSAERAGQTQPGRRCGALADANDNAAGAGREPGQPAAGRAEPAQLRDGSPADAEGSVQPSRTEGAHAAALVRARVGAGRGAGTGTAAAGVDGLVGSAGVEWGPYGPAIRRWEHVTGRAAPRPTEPGRTGERLNPRFVEWMQGLTDGWVTDVLPRNPALKCLGNGVVPQQAALAARTLLELEGVAA